MSAINQFNAALSEGLPAALQSVLDDSTKLGDLRALLLEHPELAGLSLGSLFGETPRTRKKIVTGFELKDTITVSSAGVVAATRKPKASAVRVVGGSAAAQLGLESNTRTAEGRAGLDAAVLEAVTAMSCADGVAAQSIKVAATPAQRRQSLNRLIEAGKITWEGQARGTRYWPVG